MNIKLLASVARLADKYNCASAFYYPATAWLTAMETKAHLPGYESLFVAAMQLDSPSLFHKISQSLIMDWTGSFKRLAEKGEVDMDVICMLYALQSYNTSFSECQKRTYMLVELQEIHQSAWDSIRVALLNQIRQFQQSLSRVSIDHNGKTDIMLVQISISAC